MAQADISTAGSSFNLKFILRALKYRNYRLFFSGQLISLIGTWLTTVATGWLVYRLARADLALGSLHSAAFVLGVVGFAGQIPQLVLAPFAGVWTDRLSRHKILVVTQALSMLQSALLAYLAVTHQITIPHIVILNAFQGIVNAFDMPARQSFVVEVVDNREDLSNAIALSSSMVHGARLIGPAIAGFLIYRFGEASCFIIDAVSYLAVLIALLAMQLKPLSRSVIHKPVLHEFKEGLRYAWNFLPIRSLLLLTAVSSILSMSLSTLLPIFADTVLGGQERIYGLLLGASGLGAFAGAVTLAARRTVVGLGRVIALANSGLGFSLVVFGFSKSLPLSLAALILSGFCMVLQLASTNTVLQTIVDEDKRGRTMSLFSVAFMGMAPIGSLLGGFIADKVDAPLALGFCGIILIATGINFKRRLPRLKGHVYPIYARLGLIAAEIPPSPLH